MCNILAQVGLYKSLEHMSGILLLLRPVTQNQDLHPRPSDSRGVSA